MIALSVIPKSFEDLQTVLVKSTFASTVQIDVVDGEFASPASWPYQPEGNVADAASLISAHEVEVDLMVKDSIEAGRTWLEAGAKALVFHIEGVSSMNDVFALQNEMPYRLGISLNNDTSLEAIHPYLDKVDFVQVMGIAEIGSQGQPFDNRSVERIATLRALYPGLIISVDGAVSEDNILELKKAGADSFAIGSAILKSPDPEAKYQQLLKIIS